MISTKINYRFYDTNVEATLTGEHAHFYVYDDDTDLLIFDRILAVPLRNIVDIESTHALTRRANQGDDQTDVSSIVYV